MPQRGRSRRAAARQTQLGQRKKRQGRGPSGVPSVSIPDAAQERASDDGADPLAEKLPQASRPPTAGAQAPSLRRQVEPRPTVYNYVRAEVKRIAALAAGVLAILIALSFVLR